MEKTRTNSIVFIGLVVISFAYYYLLCAKSYTWMFASFDSGDWLASSQIWMTPQPYGSPLYVLLGHLINILPVDLIKGMTIGLSVLPASITVGVVYLIITKLGYEKKYALLGSFVLLACGIFLSQATVLEEYAIATMFVTLAFYCYISEKKILTAICLGLGTAVHIIVAPIAFVWLIANLKQWRNWVTPIAVYSVVTIGFYLFVVWTMYADTPKIIAGDFSLQGINAYLGSTGTIGKISLHETPQRLLEAESVLLLGFGVCLIPLVWGLRKPWDNKLKMIFLSILFCIWLYITDTDFTTWTFTIFAIPLACIAIAIGLSKMPRWSNAVVILWIGTMLILNGLFLNANTLTAENNEPELFYEATLEIPDNSAIVCSKGGAYGMGIMYAMASGKEFTPLFLQHEEGWINQGYLDYLNWIKKDHDMQGANWMENIDYCYSIEKEIYIPYYILPPEWQEMIDEDYRTVEFNDYYRQITEVYEYPHTMLGKEEK